MPHERYRGAQAVAFMACLLHRTPLFVAEHPTLRSGRISTEEADRQGCDLILVCFMPDHLHAFTRGRCDDSDGLAAFEGFKRRSALLLDRFHRPAKWQENFYDHIVRGDEDWRTQAKYNALNPVRKGLIEDAHDYPYFFSSLGTKDEVLARIFWDG